MGILQSSEEQFKPRYREKDYTKRRPGKNVYKIDGENVYWRGEKVEGVNGSNFSDFGHGYAKNHKYVFYKGFKLKATDTDSFMPLSYKYAKDINNVYYRGRVIPIADVNSFIVKTNYSAQDKNNKYYRGKKLKQKSRSRSS